MENMIALPENYPKSGETYKHYKGDFYEVVSLALHSNDDEWMVVYKPLYDKAAADLFTRPLREWYEEVEWTGKQILRFTKIRKAPFKGHF